MSQSVTRRLIKTYEKDHIDSIQYINESRKVFKIKWKDLYKNYETEFIIGFLESYENIYIDDNIYRSILLYSAKNRMLPLFRYITIKYKHKKFRKEKIISYCCYYELMDYIDCIVDRQYRPRDNLYNNFSKKVIKFLIEKGVYIWLNEHRLYNDKELYEPIIDSKFHPTRRINIYVEEDVSTDFIRYVASSIHIPVLCFRPNISVDYSESEKKDIYYKILFALNIQNICIDVSFDIFKFVRWFIEKKNIKYVLERVYNIISSEPDLCIELLFAVDINKFKHIIKSKEDSPSDITFDNLLIYMCVYGNDYYNDDGNCFDLIEKIKHLIDIGFDKPGDLRRISNYEVREVLVTY